jgi:copper resistance protein D
VSAYYITVTIHVFAALFWLGGMFFFALIGAPVLRQVEPPSLRAELFRQLGGRFRDAGWLAIVVLIITGVLNLHFRGLLNMSVLGSAAFWSTPYGTALGWKLAAVGGMLVLQAVHDFRTGPAASRLQPGSAAMLKARRTASLLARGSAVLGIIVVIAAVRLARGG